ncbi:hypothetical protein ABPG75_007955 [Micractinium tetrahymenae]
MQTLESAAATAGAFAHLRGTDTPGGTRGSRTAGAGRDGPPPAGDGGAQGGGSLAGADATIAVFTELIKGMRGMEEDEHCVCSGCKQKACGLRKCSRCRHVSYCSRECQKAHWAEHKQDCKPAHA